MLLPKSSEQLQQLQPFWGEKRQFYAKNSKTLDDTRFICPAQTAEASHNLWIDLIILI